MGAGAADGAGVPNVKVFDGLRLGVLPNTFVGFELTEAAGTTATAGAPNNVGAVLEAGAGVPAPKVNALLVLVGLIVVFVVENENEVFEVIGVWVDGAMFPKTDLEASVEGFAPNAKATVELVDVEIVVG